MRYDLYRAATFVASYDFPEGAPTELHPNKGRLLKDDPSGFDPPMHRPGRRLRDGRRDR